ncbi:MAG: ABC transporter ATP-binding protein [Chloroflexota bacterium]
MIKTVGLTKRFAAKVAVDAIDLQVGEGEVFGFLGPNGAGKTTTVRMLTCLIGPTAGQAWLGDWQVGRDDEHIRSNVGILTEAPGLYERFSARFNLEFHAKLHGLPSSRRAAQVEKYLRMLDLWDRRDESVGTFSKGMKQRMAIARAVVHEPRVLFLDEPTSGLDPEAAHTVRDFISDLRAAGRTIFLCTHNLDEANRLCDRIAILNQRIVATGSPAELRQRLYGRRTVLQMVEPHAEALAAIRRLPFAATAEAEGDKIVVPVSEPTTQNPALVREAVQAGAQVLYVTELEPSLEDVYLSLVGNTRRAEVKA